MNRSLNTGQYQYLCPVLYPVRRPVWYSLPLHDPILLSLMYLILSVPSYLHAKHNTLRCLYRVYLVPLVYRGLPWWALAYILLNYSTVRLF